MANKAEVMPALNEADERAFDRAVRRLPGFWTWDYEESGSDVIHVVVSPPWSPATEAFLVMWDATGYSLEGALDRTVEGRYETIEELVRVMRAVVMGDPLTPSTADAKPEHAPRLTAKGRPGTPPNPNELTEVDIQVIEDTLVEWEDQGIGTIREAFGGHLYASWDDRFAAFVIERRDGKVFLTDSLTFDPLYRATADFTCVAAALAAVRCVILGSLFSDNPEANAFFEARRKLRFPGT